jgi:hypothetical protein
MDEKDISKLLRLKRYEQPPPGYFEDFLAEFQQRQRAELSRVSSFSLFVERLQSRFHGLVAGPWAYGGAAGVFIALGMAFMLTAPGGTPSQSLAQNQPSDTLPETNIQAVASTNRAFSRLRSTDQAEPAMVRLAPRFLAPQWSVLGDDRTPSRPSADHTQPVYVLDARPVSYEAPFSF